ncbi:MAG: tol-pal system-associated acyl-CoA thioesterase [Alphaproteobacteria bacterium]
MTDKDRIDWAGLPPGGAFFGARHLLPVRIYYEDTDFSGMVYHANYLRFLERGRSDCLRLAGVHHAELWARAEPLAFTIRRIEMTFHRPARIDDTLVVVTQFTMAIGARIEARQWIMRGDELIFAADVFAACINAEGRPRRLPGDVVTLMEPYVAPIEPPEEGR